MRRRIPRIQVIIYVPGSLDVLMAAPNPSLQSCLNLLPCPGALWKMQVCAWVRIYTVSSAPLEASKVVLVELVVEEAEIIQEPLPRPRQNASQICKIPLTFSLNTLSEDSPSTSKLENVRFYLIGGRVMHGVFKYM